ncbi:MAG: hypothetical protein AAF957_03360 [Planctomycetota bacterium]
MTLQHEQLGARRRAATPDRGAPTRRVLGAVLAGALATSLSACGGPGDVVEITKTRVAAVPSKTALPGADVRSRLGMRNRPDGPGQGQAAPSPQDAGSLFDFDLPEGWEELAPTQFRLVNLRSKSDPTAEITLSFLGGDGGGLTANVNRWRGQVGLEAASDLEVQAYPKRIVLGVEATYLEFTGPYQGMGGPKIEDGALYGAIFSEGGGTLFIKMTGPRETLEANRDTFTAFLDSLRINAPQQQAGPTSGDAAPHQMVRPTPQEGAPAGAGATQERPPSPLVWTTPSGWTEEAGTSRFREVTFRKGGVEMYISLARGGVLPNVNRWAKQLGMDELDDAALEALPRSPMLGRSATIFEGEGTLKAMRDPMPKPDQRMLAAIVEDGGLIVTVKTIGPSAEVDAARNDFHALITTIANR